MSTVPNRSDHECEAGGFGSIPELLRLQAHRQGDRLALCAPGVRPLSYSRLWARVQDLVQTFNRLGLGRGDRVAIVLPGGPDLAVAFLATAAGAVSAPLNPAYREEEFEFYLSDLGAEALITEADNASPAVRVARARRIRVLELARGPEALVGGFTLSGPGFNGSHRGEEPPRADDVALVLHTSGTTSRPKVVPLTHANLCASAANVRDVLALTPEDRCLNVMPLFHVHGLVAALLASLAAGSAIVCTPGFYAPEFFRWMDEFRPTWYTAVPTMHQSILARAPVHRDVLARRRLRFVRSSSSALPPRIMAELEAVFEAPVIEAYGMTEAAHQMASNQLPPGSRKAGSVGAAAGPELAVMDEAGHLLPPKLVGEVVICGSNVMGGYENNPEANQRAFTDGWFHTGDQGFLDPEGYVFITGRLKEIINRGGEKIAPREVEEALLGHPAVAEAAAFAVPDAVLGEEVGAAVVLRGDARTTERELREFAASRLADFKVPRIILLRDELPKGPTGKVQRIGLAARLGLEAIPAREPPRERPFVAPRTPLEEILAGIWVEVLDIERLGVHDHFLDVGGDSMIAARLVSRVRQELRLELPQRSLFDAPTVADQAAVIEELLQVET